MKRFLDLFGSAGAVAVAACTPCCFPLLGVVGTAVGLGFLEAYSSVFMTLFQVMVAVSAIGAAIAYRQHRNGALLALGLLSAAAALGGFYTRPNPVVMYAGMAGLVISALWSTRERRRSPAACRVAA